MIIASFNVENLFSRAKALNLRHNENVAQHLAYIGLLQEELKRTTYDKAKIFELFKKEKEYIAIQENRGKLFKYSGTAQVGVKANGRADWDGEIVFRREGFNEMARKATAKVIRNMKPDVLCVVEVEDRPTLEKFYDDEVKTTTYKLPYNMCIDGFDPRGIDVALLSKYPIANIRTHIFDKEKPTSVPYLFSRDCLEIELQVTKTKSLHILCNHLKSQLTTGGGDDDARRKKQAERIKKILTDNYDLKKDWVVVAGDFNDVPGSDPLKPLLNMQHLHDVFDVAEQDEEDRWTYFYQNKYQQIDFLLVSEALKDKVKRAGVERGGMFEIENITKKNEKRFSIIEEYKDAASDHAGIWAELDV